MKLGEEQYQINNSAKPWIILLQVKSYPGKGKNFFENFFLKNPWLEFLGFLYFTEAEAAVQRCYYGKVFWKYAANEQENTHAEVQFQ